MIYQLNHADEIETLPFAVTGKLLDDLFEFLVVLDNEYGADRDVGHDDGGYVLFCPSGTREEEIKTCLECYGVGPEWVIQIGNESQYLAALYMPRDEYSIVLIVAASDAPVEISEFEQKQRRLTGNPQSASV